MTPKKTARRPRCTAAVAIVLRRSAQGPRVLLIERSRAPEDPWSGHMAFPGGRREPRDKDLLATCLRETREETGLRLRPDQLLGRLPDAVATGLEHPIGVRPYLFRLSGNPRLHCSSELRRVLWVSFGRLAASFGPARLRRSRRPLRVQGFRAGRRVVWGMTGRLLERLLAAYMSERQRASTSSSRAIGS